MRSSLALFALLPSAITARSLHRRSCTSPPKNDTCVLPSTWSWTSTGPLIGPKDDGRNLAGIKDPSVIFYDGVYHVFASTAKEEGYNLVYMNFTSWEEAPNAEFFYLDQAPLGPGYRAAPQVFWFEPHKLWYLVYQNDNAAYSTNPDISNPAGWTAPKTFYPEMPQIIKDHIGPYYWVDMWVICDEKLCHLFSSDDNGQLYRSKTKIEDFPEGMSEPVIVMSDPDRWRLFEASCVYRVKGAREDQKYLLLVEAIGTDEQRWFRSWTSSRIEGPWKPLAHEEDNAWARSNNVVFEEGVDAWTKSISHGEIVRTHVDQTLTIEPCGIEFLYQGMDPSFSDLPYNALPWRLALIRHNWECTCS